MDNRRVLVTGAGGQVATALRQFLADAEYCSHGQLDVRDLDRLVERARGKAWIVHTAAYTDVDGCEADPERATAVNDLGTRNVVRAARAAGARVLNLSTDYVFSGDEPPYREDDRPAPVNVYGTTKLAGEHHADPRAGDLVVRSSWIFGSGRNFIRTIVERARNGPVAVVDDQVGLPTAADDLARAIAFLIERDTSGVVHVAGDGEPCTWAELASLAIEHAGVDVAVERIDTPTYNANATRPVAPRPPNSTLVLDHARALEVPLVDWRKSVRDYVGSLM